MKIETKFVIAILISVFLYAATHKPDHVRAVCNDDRASIEDCRQAVADELTAHPYVEDNDFSHEDEAQVTQ